MRNPRGLELERLQVSGPRLSEMLAAGVAREHTGRDDIPYLIEPDPDFPGADLHVYQADCPCMEGRKPRPIIKGDLVACVQIKDIRGPKKTVIVDGSLVVVRHELMPKMYEWTLRTVKWENGGISLSCETLRRKKIEPMRLSSLSDTGPIRIIALARRVISRI